MNRGEIIGTAGLIIGVLGLIGLGTVFSFITGILQVLLVGALVGSILYGLWCLVRRIFDVFEDFRYWIAGLWRRLAKRQSRHKG